MNENGEFIRHQKKDEDYSTDVIKDKALAFISDSIERDAPFFTCISVYPPHGPNTPATRHIDLYTDLTYPKSPSFHEEDVSDKPFIIRDLRRTGGLFEVEEADELFVRRVQSVQAVDEMVADLVQSLEETGQLDNTYIFFTSDNGFHMGEHMLPSGKTLPYEEDPCPAVCARTGHPAGHDSHTLVDAGRVTEAQAIILAELEKRFGGSAEAARKADGSMTALANAYGNFQEAVGRAIVPSSQINELLIKQLDSMSNVVDMLVLLSSAYGQVHQTGNAWLDTLVAMDTAARVLQNPIGALTQFTIEASHNTEEWTQALIDLQQPVDDGTRAIVEDTGALDENTESTEANTRAMEEQARRAERVAQVRHDAAAELLDIEERTAAELDEIWSDYWRDQEQEWQDHQERINDIQKKAAAEAKKAATDLQKQLAKIDSDTNKRIADLTERHAKEEQRAERRRCIDQLADERLFNLELQQLAAEGQGYAIRVAIERAEILS